MTKKRKSGLADSPFFTPLPQSEPERATAVFSSQEHEKIEARDTTIPSNHDTEASRHHGVVVSRYHDTTIEFVRKAVKEFGKEAATHRFTLAEKRAIANIVHSLNMQGIRTTENEITRIAINFVIDEFNRQEKDSILGLVLQALKK